MDIIYFSGILLALFFAFLILSKRNTTLADRILAAWLCVFAVNLVIPFSISRYPQFMRILGGVDAGLFTLHSTLLYFYTQVLIDDRQALHIKDLKHLIPFLSIYLCILPFYSLDESVKFKILTFQTHIPVYLYGCMFLNLLFFLFYNVLTLFKLRKHKENILYIFSFTENQDVNWITILVMGTLVMAIAFILTAFIIFKYHFRLSFVDYIIYYFYLGYIVVIGHWGFKQGRIYHFVDENISDFYKKRMQEKSAHQKSKQTPTPGEMQLVENLTHYMETEKPFLNNELSLYDIANALDISIFKISLLLNNVMECNFYDLVNKYRTEEFKHRIADSKYDHFTLLAVALECGFNSKATFNRIFKHQTGLTPSEYKQKISS